MKFKSNQSKPQERSAHDVYLKDGDTIQGVFRGEPFEFYEHFKERQVCINKSKHDTACPICAGGGEKPSFKCKINFITRENGALVAKVLKIGWKVYEAIMELNKEYPIERTTLKISRSGAGLKAKYSVIPLRDGAISDEAEKQLSAIPLHTLVNKEEPRMREPGDDDEDLPY